MDKLFKNYSEPPGIMSSVLKRGRTERGVVVYQKKKEIPHEVDEDEQPCKPKPPKNLLSDRQIESMNKL